MLAQYIFIQISLAEQNITFSTICEDPYEEVSYAQQKMNDNPPVTEMRYDGIFGYNSYIKRNYCIFCET